MRRVPPSTMKREQIQQLLGAGAPEGNILSQLALLGVQYLGQLSLEPNSRTCSGGATTGGRWMSPAVTATVTSRQK